MQAKQSLLKRLAECRRAYETSTPEQVAMILENCMSALQDLLELEKIDWREDD